MTTPVQKTNNAARPIDERPTPESILADQCDEAKTQVRGAMFRLRDAADSAVTAGLELVREVRKTKSGQMKAVRPDPRPGVQPDPANEFDRREDTKQFEALRPTR